MKEKPSAIFGRLHLEKLGAFFKSIDRKKLPLILAVAGTAIVVLLAAVLPAAFIPQPGTDAPEIPAAPGARAALFNSFWSEDASCEVVLLDSSAFSEAELAASGERIRALHETFLFDDADPTPENSGEHFYNQLTSPTLSSPMMRFQRCVSVKMSKVLGCSMKGARSSGAWRSGTRSSIPPR